MRFALSRRDLATAKEANTLNINTLEGRRKKKQKWSFSGLDMYHIQKKSAMKKMIFSRNLLIRYPKVSEVMYFLLQIFWKTNAFGAPKLPLEKIKWNTVTDNPLCPLKTTNRSTDFLIIIIYFKSTDIRYQLLLWQPTDNTPYSPNCLSSSAQLNFAWFFIYF